MVLSLPDFLFYPQVIIKISKKQTFIPTYVIYVKITMKGYGSIREIKTSKSVSVVTDKGEEQYEQFDATYGWKDLDGEITLSLKTDSGKNVTLLRLASAFYKKLTLTVRSDGDIEEIVQKQLRVQGENESEEEEQEQEA